VTGLRDKVVIVTGGASGIGLATVKRFAREGARLVVADLHGERAEAAAGEARAAGAPDSVGLACDVSSEKQVEETVRATIQRFGRLDSVINNAGLMVFRPITEITADDWRRILGVDLLGAFFFIRQAFLHMPQGGSIVNISSIHAVETTPLVAPYATAKAALLSLTRSAAIEGTDKKIRVNAVLPGAIDTPMLWENPNVKSGVEKIDPADVGKAEDVADVIVFLASDEARFVQGASVRVDGGRLSHL
jgi:meso-butanediol dehydrogenase/(S,S)-butanediol dehydrogenase/diacetyl reductase